MTEFVTAGRRSLRLARIGCSERRGVFGCTRPLASRGSLSRSRHFRAAGSGFVTEETRNELLREFFADFDGVRFAVGIEPVGDPIERAENGECGQLGISVPENPRLDPSCDDAANTAVKAVAL